jgi:hypothetical protein
MKRLFSGLKMICTSAVLMAGFCGCASTGVQNTQSLLSAAGFSERTPSTRAQLAAYSQMAPYKLERDMVNGHSVYLYANKRNRVIYYGGDKAYERYRQLVSQQAAVENAAEAAYSEYLKNLDRNHSLNYE